MKSKMLLIAGVFLCAVMHPSVSAQQAPADAPFLNPRVPAQQRAADLISRMTLEEKIDQLAHTAPAIPRLRVPAYNWWNEGLHGVARAGFATVFPQAIGMAAAFDEPLMHDVADVISTEFRAKYSAAVHPDGRVVALGFIARDVEPPADGTCGGAAVTIASLPTG